MNGKGVNVLRSTRLRTGQKVRDKPQKPLQKQNNRALHTAWSGFVNLLLVSGVGRVYLSNQILLSCNRYYLVFVVIKSSLFSTSF